MSSRSISSININKPTILSISNTQHRPLLQLEMRGMSIMDKEVVTINHQSLEPMDRTKGIVNTVSIESITARSIATAMSINMNMNMNMGMDTVTAVTMTTRRHPTSS